MRYFAFLLIIASGCVTTKAPSLSDVAVADIIGEIAVRYAIMRATDNSPTPTPAPPSEGCVDGCTCNGTGREKTGDGLSTVDCRCPEGCDCKAGNSSGSPAPKQESTTPVDKTVDDPPLMPVAPKQDPVKMRTVYRMSGPRWNWEGVSNPSEAYMRQHMLLDHGIDATGWSREAMQIGHDNLHNGHDVWGVSTSISSGCPSGNCPSPTTYRRYRIVR